MKRIGPLSTLLAVAAVLGCLVSPVGVAHAAKYSFRPTKQERGTLFFRLRGLEPTEIRAAYLRAHNYRRPLSVGLVRRKAERGFLHVHNPLPSPRSHSHGRESRHSKWGRSRTVKPATLVIVTHPSSTPDPASALTSNPSSAPASTSNPSSDPAPDPARTSCPTTPASVELHPDAELPNQVAARPPGTTFCLVAGIYRLPAPIYLKPEDSLIGEPGATLSGARSIDQFTQSGAFWAATGQTQEGMIGPGKCKPEYPGCRRPDDVYFDDHPLRRVMSLAELGHGEFYFDYPKDTIFIADNPESHTVEAAVTSTALIGRGRDGHGGGLVSGLTIEKFAGNGIQGNDWSWTVQGNNVRLNHGAGILVDREGVVRDNYVHENGQIGIASGGEFRFNDLIEGNEVAFNNYAGYAPGWEAGGMKWCITSGLKIRDNYVHDNYGSGIWTDTGTTDVLIEKNQVNENDAEGVIIEASSDAVVRDNRIRGNGFLVSEPVWVLGAGILNENSADVSVYGNVLVDNFNGIGGTQRPRPTASPNLTNFLVHDNEITSSRGRGITGLIEIVGDPSYYSSRGNRFWHNTYHLGCQVHPFAWNNSTDGWAYVTKDQWIKAGNDVDSDFWSVC